MPYSFYEEQLAKDLKKNPEKYRGIIEVKKGKIVQEDFTEDTKPKKPTSSVNRAFNYKKAYVPPTKLCKHCGAIYAKRMRQGFREWDKKKYCSKRCAILARSA